jgi:hypothetical protein
MEPNLAMMILKKRRFRFVQLILQREGLLRDIKG